MCAPILRKFFFEDQPTKWNISVFHGAVKFLHFILGIRKPIGNTYVVSPNFFYAQPSQFPVVWRCLGMNIMGHSVWRIKDKPAVPG